jgi:hypothetical protein
MESAVEQTPWAVSLAVSLIPLILYVGMFVWAARRIAKALTSSDGRTMGTLLAECSSELKRTNELLDRLGGDKQAPSPTPEKTQG